MTTPYGHCLNCGRPMVRSYDFQIDPAHYRAQGMVRCGAKGRCHGCYSHHCSVRNPGRRHTPDTRHPLTDAEVVRLRRLVDVPDNGPDAACRKRWSRQEALP